MTSHKVTNRTKQLAIVPLNDGTTVHLAPGEQVPVEAFLLSGNGKVARLIDRKVIELDPRLPEEGVSWPVGGPAETKGAVEPAETKAAVEPADKSAVEPEGDDSSPHKKKHASKR